MRHQVDIGDRFRVVELVATPKLLVRLAHAVGAEQAGHVGCDDLFRVASRTQIYLVVFERVELFGRLERLRHVWPLLVRRAIVTGPALELNDVMLVVVLGRDYVIDGRRTIGHVEGPRRLIAHQVALAQVRDCLERTVFF